MNRDEMQRNVDAVRRLQQFVETISATFRLMSADMDRLLLDLAQPLHEIARIEQEQQEASWRGPRRSLLPYKIVNIKPKKRRRKRRV
jgi:hypothetical protein